ncbi:22578_t:CDS:1, partial [Gigaspora rosea]
NEKLTSLELSRINPFVDDNIYPNKKVQPNWQVLLEKTRFYLSKSSENHIRLGLAPLLNALTTNRNLLHQTLVQISVAVMQEK